MTQREVSVAEQLDAKLAIHSMRRHERLRRIAEGRIGWVESIGYLLGLVLIGAGLLQLRQEGGFAELLRSSQGFGSIAIGVLLLASFLWSHTQRQLNALLELVQRLERERPRAMDTRQGEP